MYITLPWITLFIQMVECLSYVTLVSNIWFTRWYNSTLAIVTWFM